MNDRRPDEEQLPWVKENEKTVFAGVYLTLFSVVGGVVLGLIAQTQTKHIPTFVPIDSLPVESVVTIVMAVATLMVLATILTGYVLNVMFFYWSVWPLDVMLSLLLGISLCFAAAHTTTPATWMLWIGATGIFGGLSYFRTWYQLDQGEVRSVEKTRERYGVGEEDLSASGEAFEHLEDDEKKFVEWLQEEKDYLLKSALVSFGLGLLLIGFVTPATIRASVTEPDLTILLAGVVILATAIITFGRYPNRFDARKIIFLNEESS